jgi:hypothetical protein
MTGKRTHPTRVVGYIRKKSIRRAFFLMCELEEMNYSTGINHVVESYFRRNPALLNYIQQGMTNEEIKAKFR